MSEQYIKINNKNKSKKIIFTDAPIKQRPTKDGYYLVSRAFVKPGVTNPKTQLHVKRGDTVMVISGKDKGKTGKILAAFPKKGKVIVEGMNIIKKHKKSRGLGQAGEIIEKEAPKIGRAHV